MEKEKNLTNTNTNNYGNNCNDAGHLGDDRRARSYGHTSP